MKKLIALAALAAATTVVTTATTALAHTSSSKASIDVGVLLPDTKSSVRWQTQDAPDLIQIITRDDAQVVAGIVGHTLRDSDFEVPCRALGWPLTIPILQLTVGANCHAHGIV